MSAKQNAVVAPPPASVRSSARFGSPLAWALAGLLAVLAFVALAAAALVAAVMGIAGALASALWQLIPHRSGAGRTRTPEGWVAEAIARQ